MTIIAGVLSRLGEVVPVRTREDLVCATGIASNNTLRHFDYGTCFITHLDIGAYRQPALAESDGALTIVVGDPILRSGNGRRHAQRREDADFLHRALLDGGAREALTTANGTFAGAHYRAGDGTLMLFTDKLGIRQLFVTITDRWVWFATKLSTLRQLPETPKALDLGALVEEAALHCAMGRQSPYLDTVRLGAGELLTVQGARESSAHYWSIRDVPPTLDSPEEQLNTAHKLFRRAIRSRITQPVETAFLSGGLDSRSIVATLAGEGVAVNSVNFAPDGTQDRVFAEMVAERLATNHIQIPFAELERGDTIPNVARFLRSGTDAPLLIWSGNGGSVGFGFVYATEDVLKRMRCRDFGGAIDSYLRDQGGAVTRRPYRNWLYERYADRPRQSILAEFERLAAQDPARTFYFFLMENDQRRSLHRIYERIDEHRIEFQLPFFDGDFIAYVASLDPADLLNHKFYNRWLSGLHGGVSAMPWQSYPGHEPCPVEMPAELGYQFDSSFSKAYARSQRNKRLSTMCSLVTSPTFPSRYISRLDVLLGGLLQFLGRTEYAYTVETAKLFHDHVVTSG